MNVVHETMSWWMFLPVVGVFYGVAYVAVLHARKVRKAAKERADVKEMEIH